MSRSWSRYQPLVPPPDPAFSPDGEYAIQTPRSGELRLPGESCGQMVVMPMQYAWGDSQGHYAVLHLRGNLMVAAFKSLRVARNFAAEIDARFDADALFEQFKAGNQQGYLDFNTYCYGRSQHPTVIRPPGSVDNDLRFERYQKFIRGQ